MACKTRLRVGKTMGSAHTEKGKKREGEESWAQGRPWTGSGKGGEGGGKEAHFRVLFSWILNKRHFVPQFKFGF